MERVSDIPSVVTGLDGRKVRVSEEARWQLAHGEAMGELSVYQAGPDKSFWNVWLNDRIDPESGYRGMRIPVADFVEQVEQDVA
jgi:hypothetical protein